MSFSLELFEKKVFNEQFAIISSILPSISLEVPSILLIFPVFWIEHRVVINFRYILHKISSILLILPVFWIKLSVFIYCDRILHKISHYFALNTQYFSNLTNILD